MLVEPQDYFYFNAREGQLAQEVWEIAENQRKSGKYQLTPPDNLFGMLPGFLMCPPMRRLLYAHDFITTERTYGTLNASTKTTYTRAEVANVEHFYTAAFLAVIGGMYLAGVGSALWDGIISPGLKMIRSKGRAVRGVAYDLKQLTIYDKQGAAFGCACSPGTLVDPNQLLFAAIEAANSAVGAKLMR